MDRLVLRDADGAHRPPRIALVIDRFDGRGGAEAYTRDLAAWLAARDADVHVIAREGEPGLAHGLSHGQEDGRVEVHVVGPHRSTRSFDDTARRLISQVGADVSHDMGSAAACDIFHSHVGSPTACQRGAAAAHAAWYRPVRHLLGAFGRRRRLQDRAREQFGARESLFIAMSRRGATDLAAFHGVSPDRIRLVANGIDTDRFHPAAHRIAGAEARRRFGFGPDDVVVVAVAHNRRLKGVHVLARAARRLHREGLPVKLLICGGRHAGTTAGGMIVEAGCVADMAPLYAAADIAVQQTFYDACSLATLESLASGLPVVTTRCNGAAELLAPGVDAIVLDDPADAAALEAALRRLASNRWLRASLGRAARRRAEDLGIDAAFAAVVAIYGEVVARRGCRLVGDGPGIRRLAA